MSTNPPDPFDDPQGDPAAGQNSGPKRSGNKGCMIGCVVAGLVSLVVCCGGGILITQYGVSMLASEYERQLAGNPVIVEHIGEIESLEPSWSATIQEAQNADPPGQQTSFAFEVKGSKGSGTLLVQQDKSGDGTGIASAALVMPDGTRHAIDISEGPSAVDDLDVDLSDLIDTGDLEVEGDSDDQTEQKPAEENPIDEKPIDLGQAVEAGKT